MRTKRPPRVPGLKTNAGQRSMKYLRDRGWHAIMLEHYVAGSQFVGSGQKSRFAGGYRKDAGGFIDILCFRVDPVYMPVGADSMGPLWKWVNFLAVQATSRQQIAPHLRAYREVEVYVKRGSPEQEAKKRLEHAALVERMLAWIKAPGGAMVLHGWEPVSVPKKSGNGDKVQWTLTERIVTAADLVPAAATFDG